MSFWRALTGRALVASDEAAISVASSPEASIPREERVPGSSPARLLAKSLTDPETRGEWVSEQRPSVYSWTTDYINEARSITVTKSYHYGSLLGSSDRLTTPFTLSKAEETIIYAALELFERRLRDEREQDALTRLVAPRPQVKRAKA